MAFEEDPPVSSRLLEGQDSRVVHQGGDACEWYEDCPGAQGFDPFFHILGLSGHPGHDHQRGKPQQCCYEHPGHRGQFVLPKPAEGVLKQVVGYPVRRFHWRCRRSGGRGN